jgi:hypothetical protein
VISNGKFAVGGRLFGAERLRGQMDREPFCPKFGRRLALVVFSKGLLVVCIGYFIPLDVFLIDYVSSIGISTVLITFFWLSLQRKGRGWYFSTSGHVLSSNGLWR